MSDLCQHYLILVSVSEILPIAIRHVKEFPHIKPEYFEKFLLLLQPESSRGQQLSCWAHIHFLFLWAGNSPQITSGLSSLARTVSAPGSLSVLAVTDASQQTLLYVLVAVCAGYSSSAPLLRRVLVISLHVFSVQQKRQVHCLQAVAMKH